MKITKISPAAKTPGRYNIFVDGKYSFSLNETQLLEEKIKLNLEIDETRLSELKSESDFGKNYTRALDLILRRPRSEKEIGEYAKKKKWESEMTSRVVLKLKEKSYIDDRKFAEFWVSSRKSSIKPKSKKTIYFELLKKGIKTEYIKQSLDNFSDEEEYDKLKKLIEKKAKKYQDKQKLIAYLATQGFNYSMIKKAFEEKFT